ncbi:MAG: U32 family peptidase [SAR324 cluster bacterium]|nr:U32 family peptidase [SAR324 cluster bacterium]
MVTTKLTFNTFVNSSSQLSLLQSTSIKEVILEHKDLSRLGSLGTTDIKKLIHKAHEQGLFSVIQWDILGTDEEINRGVQIIQQLPISKINAIRIQDLGIAELIRQNFPQLPIHLIVETGNHNLIALKQWVNYFGKQLQRLILSLELPGFILRQYCEMLPIPCEILGLGKIPLFYTSRKLLTPLRQTAGPPFECSVTSDELQQHYFPTLENSHGTFMFYYYDLFLLDLLPELKETHLGILRLDLRSVDSFEWIQQIDSLQHHHSTLIVQELKAKWPIHTTHGFYRANRTDRPIARLKNKYLMDYGPNLVAYVIESVKGQHITVMTRQSFCVNECLLFTTPEGKDIKLQPSSICNTHGQEVESTDRTGVWLIPYHKWIVPKTLIYRMDYQQKQEGL